MNIHFYFPTAICGIMNVELAEQMLPIAQKFLEKKELLTYTWNYKNTYSAGVGIEQFTEFDSFISIIKTYCSTYMNNIGYDISENELEVYLFASEMQKGDSHGIHSHQNCILSGVFYLQAPPDSAELIIHDPRPFRKFINYPKIKQTEATWERVNFKPEKGLLLLWESWIEHEVAKNNSQDGRITLVFNVVKK